MDLSIIIVNWNTCDLLVNCLESLIADAANYPNLGYEILIVDNDSSDGTVKIVREKFPQVCIIENSQNVGFARANNQAIRQSVGDFVLLLNSDTEVRTGALKTMLEFLIAEPNVGVVGAQLLNSDGSLQVSCYPTPTLRRELWRLFHLDRLIPYGSYPMLDWDRNKPRLVEALLGACLLIRRQVLDEVGLLDEGFFMYSEEIDYCYRVGQIGWHICWVPKAQVVHHGGKSTKQASKEMFLYLYGSKLKYFRKHYGRFPALIYKFILIAAVLARLGLTPFVLLQSQSTRRENLRLAANYGRLLKALPGM